MKHTTLTLLAVCAIAILALVLVAGCGGGSGDGKKTQDLESPWDGTLAGLETAPADGEQDIAVDSWLHVFWPDENYPPPARFTVRLEKEESPNEWGGIHTNLRLDYSDPDGGSWWLEPVNLMSRGTWYRIIVRDANDPDNFAEILFRTSNVLTVQSASPGEKPQAVKGRYRPQGAENAPLSGGTGAIEHTVKTK